MWRSIVAAATLASAGLLTPSHAFVGTIAAIPGSFAPGIGPYGTPVVVAQQGAAVTFANLDIVEHDVASTAYRPAGQRNEPWCTGPTDFACEWFESAVIPGLTTTSVKGMEDTPANTYTFICRLHPYMSGTLIIV